MTHVHVQLRLARTSGLPEDVVVNTFNFDTALADPLAESELIADELEEAYSAIATYISAGVERSTGNSIKFFNMSESEPRVPFRDREFVFTGSAGSAALPSECAVCVSYKGEMTSGVPAGRRRGRFYVGPVTTGATTFDATYGDTRLTTTAMDLFVETFGNTAVTIGTDGGPVWSVWSRADAALYPVESFWVDDVVDIQRRRGAAPRSRSVFPAP